VTVESQRTHLAVPYCGVVTTVWSRKEMSSSSITPAKINEFEKEIFNPYI